VWKKSSPVLKHCTCRCAYDANCQRMILCHVVRYFGLCCPVFVWVGYIFYARKPDFAPGSALVEFVVDIVALGQVFPPESFGFPLSVLSHAAADSLIHHLGDR
jgi:hypothetical protein